MRVFIAGAGHAGLSVAAHLRTGGHDVSIVDRDEAASRRAFEQHGLVALTGDATSAALLREAEVRRADVVVAMLRRDADNLAVALLAKAAGVKRVMVRMRDSEYRGVYLAAGVHRILSETDVLIGALATAIEYEAVRHSMVLGAGASIAFELVIPEDAAVTGHAVSEIASHERFPASCVFAGITEPVGSVEAPRGSSVVTGGMAVLLVVGREDLGRAIEFFMSRDLSFPPRRPPPPEETEG
jgi:trk system potassium uptake protein